MATTAPVIGVILAGGRSRRMGADKAWVRLGGRPLVLHVAARLAPQVDRVVVNVGGNSAPFGDISLAVAPDPVPGFAGPLAGILAGMVWATDHAPDAVAIATVPVDTPFLPADLIARLAQAREDSGAIAIARSGGRPHPVCGLFPVALRDDLAAFLRNGRSFRVTDWLSEKTVMEVDFGVVPGEPDPFFNINTPADLAAAEEASALPG